MGRMKPLLPRSAYDADLALQLAGGDTERAVALCRLPLFQVAARGHRAVYRRKQHRTTQPSATVVE